MKASLDQELSSENQRHYDLRKECAYKETAMQDMRSKKVK